MLLEQRKIINYDWGELIMPTSEESTLLENIQYQKWMYDTDVNRSIEGFLLRHDPKNVRGVLLKALADEAIKKNDPQYEENFKKYVQNALLDLEAGKTRIAFPIHFGNHFATVAIDINEKSAVIVEPMQSYQADVNKVKGFLTNLFQDINGFKVEECAIKIQDDGWNCGYISSKLAEHFLTCECDLSSAIKQEHLPKAIKDLKNGESAKKELVTDVQNAYLAYQSHHKNVVANNSAIQTTTFKALSLSILNLAATNQLEGDLFKVTQAKLLELYTIYLTQKNNNTKPDAKEISWDKFKHFLLNQQSDGEQQKLAQDFSRVFEAKFQTINDELFQTYHPQLKADFLKEFENFLGNKADDGHPKIYLRIKAVRREFKRLMQDKTLNTTNEKVAALEKWWRDEFIKNKKSIVELSINGFPNEYDLTHLFENLSNINFNFGTAPNRIVHYPTADYGTINQNQIFEAGLYAPYVIRDLCDVNSGIIIKLEEPNNNIYRFTSLTNEERTKRLKAILTKHSGPSKVSSPGETGFVTSNDNPYTFSGLPAAINPDETIVKFLKNAKEPSLYPTVTLTKDNDQWHIIDEDPNHTWLKIKSFKPEIIVEQIKPAKTTEKTDSPKTEEKSTAKTDQKKRSGVTSDLINFTTQKAAQIIKTVCGTLPNTQVISNTQFKVGGKEVEVFENGFRFTEVTKEIIEACVKAMAAIFNDANIMDKNKRVVKLNLSKEHEQFRADYIAELQKHDLILSENKWQAIDDAHNKKQSTEENKENVDANKHNVSGKLPTKHHDTAKHNDSTKQHHDKENISNQAGSEHPVRTPLKTRS